MSDGIRMIDEVDYKILKALIEDSRRSISDLSKRLGLSRPTVRQRLKALVDKGIIQGFTIKISENYLKPRNIILFSFKAKDAEELAEKLKEIKEIYEIYITSGDENLIAKAEVNDLKALKNLLSKIEKLGVTYRTHIILRVVKEKQEILDLCFKAVCEYCGKEILGESYEYTLYNRKFVFCCTTCLKEFKKMREQIS